MRFMLNLIDNLQKIRLLKKKDDILHLVSFKVFNKLVDKLYAKILASVNHYLIEKCIFKLILP